MLFSIAHAVSHTVASKMKANQFVYVIHAKHVFLVAELWLYRLYWLSLKERRGGGCIQQSQINFCHYVTSPVPATLSSDVFIQKSLVPI